MSDVTQILSEIQAGNRLASEELLPLVYDELRQLAAYRMAFERSDHMLQATALVHEAYLRLMDGDCAQDWECRRHFFAAAAEAMRRILVEEARRRGQLKRGGHLTIDALTDMPASGAGLDLAQALDLHDAVDRLCHEDQEAGELVKIRCFGGLSVEEAGKAMGMSRATAYKIWAYAKAWLRCELVDSSESS